MALTPAQLKVLEDALLAAQQNNRILYPPVASAGIGHFQSAIAPAMFGGLSLLGPVANQPLTTTPEKLIGWEGIIPAAPANPEGILPIAADSDITLLAAGVYQGVISINAVVATGAGFVIEIYIDDVATGVAVAQDLSNQTGFFSVQFSSPLVIAAAGVKISLYGRSDNAAPQQFEMQNSLMFLTRIR